MSKKDWILPMILITYVKEAVEKIGVHRFCR
jgi:hypothetical protein